jgi:hypothetical protein
VLRLLGHTFEIQTALRTADGVKKPDYIFYRDGPRFRPTRASRRFPKPTSRQG